MAGLYGDCKDGFVAFNALLNLMLSCFSDVNYTQNYSSMIRTVD